MVLKTDHLTLLVSVELLMFSNGRNNALRERSRFWRRWKELCILAASIPPTAEEGGDGLQWVTLMKIDNEFVY